MLYELAKHPEIQDRLVQEISSVVGDKEHPSWEDLQKLTLVRNCVKETMRLYDPTGGTIRVLARDATVSGYHVPAGVSLKPVLSEGLRDLHVPCIRFDLGCSDWKHMQNGTG